MEFKIPTPMNRNSAILAIAFLALGIATMQEKWPQPRIAEKMTLKFNDGFATFSGDALRLLTFGYGKTASDLLWLRFLYHTPPKKLEDDEVSWLYLDLNAVSELDPDFIPAYEYGGVFLSVITEDRRGAEQILKKGIERFPERWRLPTYLAYHYQFEMKDYQKAKPYYLTAAKLPDAPMIVKIIAASILSTQNKKEASVALLKQLINENKSPFFREKLKQKLEKVQKGPAHE
jgi:tetratricopeptide (TPR) repeat protein